MERRPTIGAGIALIAVTALGTNARSLGEVDFIRDVRPVLAEHCFKCHGPDARARKAGLRLDRRDGVLAPLRSGRTPIVPGDPDASSLLRRVRSNDDDHRMPPPEAGAPLREADVAILKRWIRDGAPYARHWAFVAPDRAEPAAVRRADWPAGVIDRFVLARLESEGLEPAPPADRATWIRRVSLDVTGLPPSPADVNTYLADDAPDADARLVDRLLASPAYGERWARVWLDVARYADTKGYEADRRRTIWPYRDWVIRALNRDMPFDAFTIEQLAGDLLPEATIEQRLATAFHRNTMTNDEGGTDDEEFRVEAVIDRVNTTMQVWMGVTMGCAQCHDHKYDPISQREYYQLFAYFDNTADQDANDEHPRLALPTVEQRHRLERLDREFASLDRELDESLSRIVYVEPALARAPSEPAARTRREHVWIDDDLPLGARSEAHGATASWTWVTATEGPVFSGGRASTGQAREGEVAQHLFTQAHFPLTVHAGDTLFTWVNIDPDDPPQQIMLQWHDESGSWEHRAYWGEDQITWGTNGTPSRRRAGDLPPPGTWVRLEIPAAEVGLEAGAAIDGWAFAQFGGAVTWDRSGVVTTHPPDDGHLVSQRAWERRVVDLAADRLPEPVHAALHVDPATRSEAQQTVLRRYYLEHVHGLTRGLFEAVRHRREELDRERRELESVIARVPVMEELTGADRRVTHVLGAGSFLNPQAVVAPDVPEVFPPLPDGAPATRLGVAQWLVHEDNPLTARVFVNRVWAQLFGTGLVETVEDFGVQGALPSHPELLDRLAVDFVDSGWSMKTLLRMILLSSTYRQSAAASADVLERDPHNRLLARGPRFRLEAEIIRDQALAVSGLLDRTMYGPPVFPPQPDGIWQVIYSDDRWATAEGPDRYRRALYTFWRRTSPYPSLITFDAPSREFCVPRRIRTNTPLQALVTLNDPVFVEAAQGLARRILAEAAPATETRAAYGLRLCLARPPNAEEITALTSLHDDVVVRYRDDPEAATQLATDPLGPLPGDVDVSEAAAWTVVANVLLNLDEFLTKR